MNSIVQFVIRVIRPINWIINVKLKESQKSDIKHSYTITSLIPNPDTKQIIDKASLTYEDIVFVLK